MNWHGLGPNSRGMGGRIGELGGQVEPGLQGKAADLRLRLGIARGEGYFLSAERAGWLWREEVREGKCAQCGDGSSFNAIRLTTEFERNNAGVTSWHLPDSLNTNTRSQPG